MSDLSLNYLTISKSDQMSDLSMSNITIYIYIKDQINYLIYHLPKNVSDQSLILSLT